MLGFPLDRTSHVAGPAAFGLAVPVSLGPVCTSLVAHPHLAHAFPPCRTTSVAIWFARFPPSYRAGLVAATLAEAASLARAASPESSMAAWRVALCFTSCGARAGFFARGEQLCWMGARCCLAFNVCIRCIAVASYVVLQVATGCIKCTIRVALGVLLRGALRVQVHCSCECRCEFHSSCGFHFTG